MELVGGEQALSVTRTLRERKAFIFLQGIWFVKGEVPFYVRSQQWVEI